MKFEFPGNKELWDIGNLLDNWLRKNVEFGISR